MTPLRTRTSSEPWKRSSNHNNSYSSWDLSGHALSGHTFYPASFYPVTLYPVTLYPVTLYPASFYPVTLYPVTLYPATLCWVKIIECPTNALPYMQKFTLYYRCRKRELLIWNVVPASHMHKCTLYDLCR